MEESTDLCAAYSYRVVYDSCSSFRRSHIAGNRMLVMQDAVCRHIIEHTSVEVGNFDSSAGEASAARRQKDA
jgi:hypothetical protein